MPLLLCIYEEFEQRHTSRHVPGDAREDRVSISEKPSPSILTAVRAADDGCSLWAGDHSLYMRAIQGYRSSECRWTEAEGSKRVGRPGISRRHRDRVQERRADESSRGRYGLHLEA